MKNHTDVLIFHRRVCAGATNSESQMKNRIRGFFIACLRKKRSGMEVFMNVKNTIPAYADEKTRQILLQKQYIRMQQIICQRKNQSKET